MINDKKTVKDKIFKEWLYQKYVIEDLYGYEIANKIKVSRQTVFNWLKKYGISSRKKGQILDKHHNWNGGISKRNQTLYFMQPYHPHNYRGYVSISNLIAEKILNRFLKDKEMVHHINFSPMDNKNHNLLICNRSYHKWLHWKIKKLGLVEYFKSLQIAKILQSAVESE